MRAFLVLSVALLAACATKSSSSAAGGSDSAARSAAAVTGRNGFEGAISVAPDLAERARSLPSTVVDYDRKLLDANETQVVAKLIDASRLMDSIFLRQVSAENPARRDALVRAASGSPAQNSAALAYFDIMKGPWDRIRNDRFVSIGSDTASKQPAGAGFYPADMTKEEFERWIAAHPGDADAFRGLFTVVRREGSGLAAVPYSQAYREYLTPAAAKLREAAALTKNASLRDFLAKRADAFLSDDYYASDLAWMDLDSDIEVVIGPYEVYEDNLFNYKASFESFVTVVDRGESDKLKVYVKHLPDMERNLPMADQYKNPNRGAESPIRVVEEIFTAGDGRRGVQTAAFNLPNDERVREAKGSKKVMLKNVTEAKFRQSGLPIAQRVLAPAQIGSVSFDPFFTHILFHELSHGLGPGIITGPDGKRQENRVYLKELYSTIEETKADVLGLWNLRYALDHKLISSFTEPSLYASYAGIMFRSMRFGLEEAHGRGTAVQWNWFREKGAVVPSVDGRYTIDVGKMREAVRSLANELLTIEATGDYARGQRLLERYGKSTPEIDRVNAALKDIPVDIAPVFPAAGERAPAAATSASR